MVDVLHGAVVPDPYRWLENGDSPDTRAWVAEQNLKTTKALETVATRARWHERLSALIGMPQTHVFARRADLLFVYHREGDQQQAAIEVGSARDATQRWRTLLDPSALASDGAVTIDWCEPSRDGQLLAVGLSEGGTENSTLHLLDVATGERHTDERDIIANTRACSLSWFADNSGFYYTRYPDGDEYNRKVYAHAIGTDWHEDELVWGNLPTPDAWPIVTLRDDGRYLLVGVGVGWSRTDLHLLHVDTGTWTVICEGTDANTHLGFDENRLVGVTDLDAPKGRLIVAELEQPQPERWRDLISESDAVLEGWWRSGDAVFVSALVSSVRRITRHESADGTMTHTLELPALADVVGVANDQDHNDVHLALTSYTFPGTTYHWSLEHGLSRWGEPPKRAFHPDKLIVKRVAYPSLDGTMIGLTIVHHADTPPSTTSRCWLTGYGGFNIALTPSFSSMVVAWCEAGGVYAVAGLRGGNDEGEAWHRAGMREQKQNVFDDFHAAADWLVANNYTSRQRLIVRGGSNGGLLMGAAMTQRPDLARAVVCEVPLLDMIRFPQFLIAKLWTHEYGDPEVAEEFDWLLAYSPYHHVLKGERYPAVFFITAEGDTRVDPCHARKMSAALQWATASGTHSPVLFKQGERAGHGAGKPASKVIDDACDVLAFIDLVV